MKIKEILDRFEEVANHPNTYISEWIKANDRKAVGAIAPFAPEELIYAAGALPVGMWGGNVNPTDAYKYYPTFYCSVITTITQLCLNNAYENLSAVVCGGLCDGLDDLIENWKAFSDIPMIDCIYPQNTKLECAVDYLTKELRITAEKLSAVTGHVISDYDLADTYKLYNAHRAAMREFSMVAGDHLDVITPLVRRDVFKSAHFMDKKEHLELVSALISELKEEPVHDFKGVRIISTGIIMDSPELLKMLEDNGIGIVGDDIIAESKRYETDIPDGLDLYRQLARQWQNRKGTCLLHEPEKLRGPMLVDMAKERNADGVLECVLKFCEVDEFDYPVLKRIFAKAGIPELHLEIENISATDQQANTRIQAFREMIGK